EQIAQGHVVIFRESLEHFEQPLFHADSGLDSFDEELRFLDLRFMDHGTNVPWYTLRGKGSENQYHFPRDADLLDSQPAMGAVDDIAAGDLVVRGENGLRHMKHIAEHERGGFLLLGEANLRCAKLRHASGLDSAGLRIPLEPDPQRDRVKTGGKRFASALDESLRRVQSGAVEPADGQRIGDREQSGNRLG